MNTQSDFIRAKLFIYICHFYMHILRFITLHGITIKLSNFTLFSLENNNTESSKHCVKRLSLTFIVRLLSVSVSVSLSLSLSLSFSLLFIRIFDVNKLILITLRSQILMNHFVVCYRNNWMFQTRRWGLPQWSSLRPSRWRFLRVRLPPRLYRGHSKRRQYMQR